MTASTFSHVRQFHQPYLKALAEKGILVDLACPDPELLEGVQEVIHVPFEKNMFAWQNLRCTQLLKQRMEEQQYDTIISHTSLASFFTRLAYVSQKKPRKKDTKIICVVHGYLFHEHASPVKNTLLLLAEKLLAKQTDLVLTMNQWDTEQAKKHHLGKEIACISGMGISIDPQAVTMPPVIQTLLQKEPHAFLLVFGGELSPRKNQQFLIQALRKLPSHIHLLLCGEGQEKQQYESLIARYHLEERVHLLGQVQDLSSFYSYSHMVVSSCISEGLPFHLMEAMALGKPCILSDIKGHRDLITHEVSGYLFPLGEEEAFLEYVTYLEKNPERCALLGEKAREKIKDYTIDAVREDIMGYYI